MSRASSFNLAEFGPASVEIESLFTDEQKRILRKKELEKYDRNYFLTEYWKEDLAGCAGNRGLSYDDPTHSERFSLIADTLVETLPYNSFLDAGCGPGLLCDALAKRSKAVTGVDASLAAVDLATDLSKFKGRNFQVFEQNLIGLSFGDSEFECVVCLDVLEHLPVFDIKSSITELIRVSRDLLILSINTDNPYHFHPTILSKDTWRAIFQSQQGLERDFEVEKIMKLSVADKRTEYEFYCYRRI